MKKIIKIFTLIIFILLVFGITTSKALEVTVDISGKVTEFTPGEQIVAALEKKPPEKLYLKNSYNVQKYHPNVFCRQHGGFLRNFDSVYELDTSAENGGVIEYPKDSNDDNKYAIAYILAHAGTSKYSKSEIQAAYWLALPKSSHIIEVEDEYKTANAMKLFNLGKAYQNFRESENNMPADSNNRIDKSKATTSYVDNSLIYGPIKIKYSYASYGSTIFGGFDFSFSGTNVDTNNVQLCKKNGTNYVNIDTDNDGKIRTADYNGIDIYIKVDINQVKDSNINMKITFPNIVNATAKVYQIKGYTENYKSTETVYCMKCTDKMESAKKDINSLKDGDLFYNNEGYWKYTEKRDANRFLYYQNRGVYKYQQYLFDRKGLWSREAWNFNVNCSVCSTSVSFLDTGGKELIVDTTEAKIEHMKDWHIVKEIRNVYYDAIEPRPDVYYYCELCGECFLNQNIYDTDDPTCVYDSDLNYILKDHLLNKCNFSIDSVSNYILRYTKISKATIKYGKYEFTLNCDVCKGWLGNYTITIPDEAYGSFGQRKSPYLPILTLTSGLVSEDKIREHADGCVKGQIDYILDNHTSKSSLTGFTTYVFTKFNGCGEVTR